MLESIEWPYVFFGLIMLGLVGFALALIGSSFKRDPDYSPPSSPSWGPLPSDYSRVNTWEPTGRSRRNRDRGDLDIVTGAAYAAMASDSSSSCGGDAAGSFAGGCD